LFRHFALNLFAHLSRLFLHAQLGQFHFQPLQSTEFATVSVGLVVFGLAHFDALLDGPFATLGFDENDNGCQNHQAHDDECH
jgi:hypothetical protein